MISDIPTCNLWEWEPLVSSGMPSDPANLSSSAYTPTQFCEGSTHRTSRGRQEDYEAVQHTRIGKEDLS